MNCPNCKEVKLVLSERKGIEIDYCPECRGIWLDRGELDKIIEKSSQSEKIDINERPYQQHDIKQYQYKRKKSFLEEIFD